MLSGRWRQTKVHWPRAQLRQRHRHTNPPLISAYKLVTNLLLGVYETFQLPYASYFFFPFFFSRLSHVLYACKLSYVSCYRWLTRDVGSRATSAPLGRQCRFARSTENRKSSSNFEGWQSQITKLGCGSPAFSTHRA